MARVTTLAPIICAGAGRSKFTAESDGTPWGKFGDAVGTMEVVAVPLVALLEKHAPDILEKFKQNDYIIQVAGSDNYKTALHSRELLADPQRALIAISNADGSDLSNDHGGGIRLIVQDAPGFRQIKWVENITVQPAPNDELVTQLLREKLKDSLETLPTITRQLLAVCPEFHSYLIRNDQTGKIIGFNLLFPLSCAILTSEKSQDTITLHGIAYSGNSKISSVIIPISAEKQVSATMTLPKHGNGNFVYWTASIAVSPEMTTLKAYAIDNSGAIQSSEPMPNKRGLYNHSSAAFYTLKPEDSAAISALPSHNKP